VPIEYGGQDLDDWFRYAGGGGQDPNYTYRHLATTYNMDRVLMPKPVQTTQGRSLRKKLNVNKTSDWDLEAIRDAIAAALTEADPLASRFDISERATQIAVNLRDFVDDDDEVSVMASSATQEFIGFERPCIYISEVACRWVRDNATNEVHKSYAIELYKPYYEDVPPNPEFAQWRLVVNNVASQRFDHQIVWSGTRRFHVLMAEDPKAPVKPRVSWEAELGDSVSMPLYGYRTNEYPRVTQGLNSVGFEEGATIYLERDVNGNGKWKQVDSVTVPAGWMQADGRFRSLQRDISPHKCIWRLWSDPAERLDASLGNKNASYVDQGHTDIVQAHPKNLPLRNIGEIGMVFATSGYYVPQNATPADILIDLANPKYSRLFNYLTVMDPEDHGRSAGETRIMGRINVNTAPWLVLAQLPWIQYLPPTNPADPYARAQGIVADRQSRGPYRSIGDLMRVPQLALTPDGSDNFHDDSPRGPDLTHERDPATDDYEERDLIFTRISDLVTVRSDVFTAYILVRIGTDGPQKRLIAVLDRSHVNGPNDRVRVLARHLVPDPR